MRRVAFSCGTRGVVGACLAAWSRSGSSAEAAYRSQTHQPDEVVRGRYKVTREVHPLQTTKACFTERPYRFHPAEDFFNGLFTNDKFCWSRPARLHLKWWHRAYRDR